MHFAHLIYKYLIFDYLKLMVLVCEVWLILSYMMKLFSNVFNVQVTIDTHSVHL